MSRYALLILPSANRVYADAATALTVAELQAFSRSVLGGRIAGAAPATIGGVPYVTFTADRIDAREAALLANLSSIYALFRVEEEGSDGATVLRPVELRPLDRFDDDLITIQKYQGKTNEQFTKLLLNVTLLASGFATEMLDRKFAVLDPLCGRGTTLNQALMYGFDATGIDLDAKDFDAYAAFIQTWLKRKRVKHHAERGRLRLDGKVAGRRMRVSLAADAGDYKSGRTQRLDLVNADTARAAEFFKPETFDLVVADAPYGVQHGSRTAAKGLARSPVDLLAAAAPAWASLLRSGGACGIAWNTLVARREQAAGILGDAGLDPVECEPYLGFRHRVDQAIVRDILVARKP